MATISRKDISEAFILLAVLFLFEGIGGGFLVGGIVGLIVIGGLAWIAKGGSPQITNSVGNLDCDLLFKASIAITFIGVLLFQYLIVAVGFLVGLMIAFSKSDTFNLDLGSLSLTGTKSASGKKR